MSTVELVILLETYIVVDMVHGVAKYQISILFQYHVHVGVLVFVCALRIFLVYSFLASTLFSPCYPTHVNNVTFPAVRLGGSTPAHSQC